MDAHLPHCTTCLKPLASGWDCGEHEEMGLIEQIARAISNAQDVDPDVFIGMHDRRSWERIYYPAAQAAIERMKR